MGPRLLVLAAAVSACSFEGAPASPRDGAVFDIDGAVADADAAADATAPLGPWAEPAPVSLPGHTTNAIFDDPLLVSPGRLLYSVTVGSVETPWVGDLSENEVSNAVMLTGIPNRVTSPWLSPDEKTLVYEANSNFFAAQRDELGNPFVATGNDWFSIVNMEARDDLSWLSDDLLSLVYSAVRGGNAEVVVSVRDGTTTPFPLGQPLAGINTSNDEVAARFATAAMETVVFKRRVGNEASSELFLGEKMGAFYEATPLDSVNASNENDADPSISGDLRQLIFSSSRDGGGLFLTTRSP